MAILDLNAPPEGEEELPDLNNKPAQEEDDGPLQDVVAADEGGGPEALPCLFHQAAGCRSPWIPVHDITLASIFMKLMKKYFVKVSTQYVFKRLLYWFYFSLYFLLRYVCCFHCLQKTVP